MPRVQNVLESKVDIPITFNNLIAAANAVGLEYTLDGPGPLTIFAPIDAAFDSHDTGEIYILVNDVDALRKLLQYHIVPLRLTIEDMMDLAKTDGTEEGLQLPTMTNEPLTVKMADSFTVNGVRVLRSNILADNGIIHIVDRILWPTALKPEDFPDSTALNEPPQLEVGPNRLKLE